MNQVADEAGAPPSEDARPSKLSLKEIRSALGENFKPIITVEEAAALSRLAVKGKQSRLVPIHPELRAILQSLPRTYEHVFTRPATKRFPGGRPLFDRLLLCAVKKLCKKCGFAGWEKFKLHTFRHAFASMCARSHVSYKYALNWMGHKSSDILDMYITMYDDAAEDAIRTIDYGDRGEAA